MTDLLIRPITIWQICGQIVDASFAIKGPPRRLMVDTVSRLITMKVMCQVNCDLSTSYRYDVNDQWSLTIQTQRFKDSQFASMPAGHWVNEHTKHTFYSQYVVSYPCKGKKTGTFKKGWGDKRLRKISQLSRDPATRRCLQTPNHRTSWTFPGCKAVNHKNFGLKKLNIFTQPVLYNREAPRASKAPLQNSRPKRFEKQNNRSKILEKHVDPKFPNFASFC